MTASPPPSSQRPSQPNIDGRRLGLIGFGVYGPNFFNHHIDGKAVVLLNQDMAKEMGILRCLSLPMRFITDAALLLTPQFDAPISSTCPRILSVGHRLSILSWIKKLQTINRGQWRSAEVWSGEE